MGSDDRSYHSIFSIVGHVLQCHGPSEGWTRTDRWRHDPVRSFLRTAAGSSFRSCHQHFHQRAEYGARAVVPHSSNARRWAGDDVLRPERDWRNQHRGRVLHRRRGLEHAVSGILDAGPLPTPAPSAQRQGILLRCTNHL